MSRIDVQTLVLAFEKRIAALEKNPPEMIATSTILKMLDKAIDDEVTQHFIYLAKLDIKKVVKKEFKAKKDEFIHKAVENILNNDDLRKKIEKEISDQILSSIAKGNNKYK